MNQVIIYHNPKCGTSRNTLAMILESGVEPIVVDYLKTPLTRETLITLMAKMEVSVREILRKKGTPYTELGLQNKIISDDVLIDAIMQHPILMNRPIVDAPKGAKLCRPSEIVLTILESPLKEPFIKEDGQVIKPS
ncbi:MAG: arsenate reductase (glutaredoxin) [Methylophilaceae bacterium]|nr:MAG: arsenate reductase (glutaredoxin) [Methylophilaceae bacterium]